MKYHLSSKEIREVSNTEVELNRLLTKKDKKESNKLKLLAYLQKNIKKGIEKKKTGRPANSEAITNLFKNKQTKY